MHTACIAFTTKQSTIIFWQASNRSLADQQLLSVLADLAARYESFLTKRLKAWRGSTAWQRADREWLKQELAAALGWEAAVAEGFVEAISAAEDQNEVEQMIQVSTQNFND